MVASIQAVASHDVALSVRDLTVNLPEGMERTHAVENISFDLKRGQILCVIGESGSGKSVTANAIMGLLPRVIHVSSGAIHLDGMNIIGMLPDKLRSLRGRVVSMIFQDPLSALNPSDDRGCTDRRGHGGAWRRHSEIPSRPRYRVAD